MVYVNMNLNEYDNFQTVRFVELSFVEYIKEYFGEMCIDLKTGKRNRYLTHYPLVLRFRNSKFNVEVLINYTATTILELNNLCFLITKTLTIK